MAALAHSVANMYQTFLTQVLELAHMILVMAMLDFGGWPFAKLNCNGECLVATLAAIADKQEFGSLLLFLVVAILLLL